MLGASVISNTFTGVHKPTLGVDFHFRRFEEAGESIALQLWDIAGRCFPRPLAFAFHLLNVAGADRFGMMYRVYYKDALGALLLFDASKPATFDAVKKVRLLTDTHAWDYLSPFPRLALLLLTVEKRN